MIKELKVGDKVKGGDYIGTVEYLSGSTNAGIKRDDGKTGRGRIIEGYGYSWNVFKRDGVWTDGNPGRIQLKLLKKGKVIKPTPVDKHVVFKDSCNNFVGIKDSFKEAVDLAKEQSSDHTIYKLTEVAKVTSIRQVKKSQVKKIKKIKK